jgi:hypothetical protein
MSLHNVKPSTTFLIRNCFVADCVAHRSREPAKTDSMDLSPRPGTWQPLPAEIHGWDALLIALAINEGHASTTQYSATFRLAPRFGELPMFTIQPIAPSDFNSACQ